jgi:acyl-CoA synthetase (AMP-forming)/AMP-acid ligase II
MEAPHQAEQISNVAWALAQRAAQQPTDLAVAVARRRRGFEEVTFAELEERVQGWLSLLRERGLGPGDRVVLMVPPSLNFFALTFALLRLETVPVLVDPGMGVKSLKRCLAEAAPQAFVGIGKALVARKVLRWVPNVRLVLRVDRSSAPAESVDARSLHSVAEASPRPTPSDQVAAILFTSGSTGPPKGVVYTHGMFCAQVQALHDHWGISPGERDLATFPLFALFGPALGMASVVPWMDASRPGTADPARLVEALEAYACTNLFASPALVDKLGRYCELHSVCLQSLRRALSAGAPASLDSIARFAAALPEGAEVHTPYGATESLPVASIGSQELLAETRVATESGAGVCVGRPLPGVAVRVIPILDGRCAGDALPRSLARGAAEIGEFAVSSAQTSASYFQRPNATALAKLRGPDSTVWHRMGDVGWIDQEGRLWMCGRKGHRVQTAQGDLFTIPCEAIFNRHHAVRRTALVGLGPAGSAEPVLCVELERWTGARRRRTIAEEVLQLGAHDPRTRSVHRVLFRKRFPVDVRHNAKIFREELAHWAARRLKD